MTNGFSRLWSAELEPWLAERDTEYKALRRKGRLRALIALAIGTLLIGVNFFANSADLLGVIAGFAVLAVAPAAAVWWFSTGNTKTLAADVKHQLLARLAGQFDLTYAATPAAPARFERFGQLGLVPKNDEQSFEDHFHGLRQGAEFELYEARLIRLVADSSEDGGADGYTRKPVFSGMLVRINFPGKVEGITVIRREAGWRNPSGSNYEIEGHKMAKIGLADPVFEKTFQVYGDDQTLARYMLTPSFMERILALEQSLGGKKMVAGFDAHSGEGEFLLAAQTGDLFETSSRLSPIPSQKIAKRIYDEIRLVTEIVDIIVSPASTAAPGPLAK
jgi:hypothetical protein